MWYIKLWLIIWLVLSVVFAHTTTKEEAKEKGLREGTLWILRTLVYSVMATLIVWLVKSM